MGLMYLRRESLFQPLQGRESQGKRWNGSLLCLWMTNPKNSLTVSSQGYHSKPVQDPSQCHSAMVARFIFGSGCHFGGPWSLLPLPVSILGFFQAGPSRFLGRELISKADEASHSYCPVAVCIFQPFTIPAPSKRLIRSSELHLKAHKLNFELNKKTPPLL